MNAALMDFVSMLIVQICLVTFLVASVIQVSPEMMYQTPLHHVVRLVCPYAITVYAIPNVYMCIVCADGDVRLMNGSVSTLSSGRVEVCVDNAYGSVCNDRWDEIDAAVVCRQLNFPPSST